MGMASNPHDTYDFILVGGGTAGCILANRLSADGKYSVLMLEAGGTARVPWVSIPAGFSKLLTHPRLNWGFRSEPEPNVMGRSISIPRGKGLGGSTLINGMIYVRGQPGDYDQWARSGAQGWGWNDVAPYFERLEQTTVGTAGRGRSGRRRPSGRPTRPLSDILSGFCVCRFLTIRTDVRFAICQRRIVRA